MKLYSNQCFAIFLVEGLYTSRYWVGNSDTGFTQSMIKIEMKFNSKTKYKQRKKSVSVNEDLYPEGGGLGMYAFFFYRKHIL